MAMSRSAPDADVGQVRAFNRFYTRQLGLLDEGLLESPLSLTESRVLYELAHRDGLTPTALGRELGIDAGYQSRLLARLESRGLLARAASPSDGRQVELSLTAAGRAAVADLEAAANRQVAGMLDALPPVDQAALVRAMGTIRRVLDGDREPRVPYVLRDLQIGDIGWVIRRQGMLYADEYGWDETFEPMVAEIAATFVKSFDRRKERAWIAEREGEIVGSAFLVHASDALAKLRLLYVEPSARGLGIGRRLVDECIRFAREKGYETLTLWTNDILVSARRIYQAAGFELVAEERHHSFGKDLVGQNWELKL